MENISCDPKNSPKVSVILVNWNGKKFLPVCLKSLQDQTFTDFEVILVDSGSHDGSVELLREAYPWVRLVLLDSNTGFANGNNRGFSIARGSTYIIALNNDTQVDPHWLEELVAVAESSPEVGMVGSRICTWDNHDIIDSLGVTLCPDGMSRGYKRNAHFSALSVAKIEKILLPSACSALYRRKMLDEIGFFDDDLFVYCDDTDLGLRGRLAGWQALLARDSIVYHRYSSTGGVFSPQKLYLVERNHFWAAMKSFPLTMLLALPFWTIVRYFVQTKLVLEAKGAGGQFRNSSPKDLIKAVLRGIWDAARGLPSISRKRRSMIRRLSDKEMRQLLKTYKLTFSELLDAG